MESSLNGFKSCFFNVEERIRWWRKSWRISCQGKTFTLTRNAYQASLSRL